MAQNEDLKLTVEAWAEIVIKIWIDKIQKKRKKRPVSSGELLNSFVYHIYTNSNGDPDRIIFAFNYYGKFIDMGVGRGVKAGELDALKGTGETRRRKKPWFSGTFDYQVEKLTELMEEKYGLKISSAIVNSLDN